MDYSILSIAQKHIGQKLSIIGLGLFSYVATVVKLLALIAIVLLHELEN